MGRTDRSVDAMTPAELPNSVYLIVGILVMSNLATVGAIIVFIFKCGMFVAETKGGISDAKERANRAHKRIDELERDH